MKRRWIWIVIGANVLVLLALAFVYPDLMVSPGQLGPGHAALATDCFACHAPLRGPAADRCIACHSLADIGLRTTKGIPINGRRGGSVGPLKMSFHQELMEPDCMACHGDHAGPGLTQRARKPFSHALLRASTRDRCGICHTAPDDQMHRSLRAGCGQCHRPEAWKPATFDHDKLFLLDADHNAACDTCHVGGDLTRYTCYGCHAHTPAGIAEEHREEGIGDLSDCVRCHRSAHEDGEGD